MFINTKVCLYIQMHTLIYVSIFSNDMEQIKFVTKIAKMGKRLYINIPQDSHTDVTEKIGKQVMVRIEDI